MSESLKRHMRATGITIAFLVLSMVGAVAWKSIKDAFSADTSAFVKQAAATCAPLKEKYADAVPACQDYLERMGPSQDGYRPCVFGKVPHLCDDRRGASELPAFNRGIHAYPLNGRIDYGNHVFLDGELVSKYPPDITFLE